MDFTSLVFNAFCFYRDLSDNLISSIGLCQRVDTCVLLFPLSIFFFFFFGIRSWELEHVCTMLKLAFDMALIRFDCNVTLLLQVTMGLVKNRFFARNFLIPYHKAYEHPIWFDGDLKDLSFGYQHDQWNISFDLVIMRKVFYLKSTKLTVSCFRRIKFKGTHSVFNIFDNFLSRNNHDFKVKNQFLTQNMIT